MKIYKLFITTFLCTMCSTLLAQIDTQVILLDHSTGTTHDTLIVAVQAQSDNDTVYVIDGFQGALAVNDVIKQANPQVSFLGQLLPQTNYTVTEDYKASRGRIRYVYAFHRGEKASVGSEWKTIVQIMIVMDRGAGKPSLSWYAKMPKFMVLDDRNSDITGKQIAIELGI